MEELELLLKKMQPVDIRLIKLSEDIESFINKTAKKQGFVTIGKNGQSDHPRPE